MNTTLWAHMCIVHQNHYPLISLPTSFDIGSFSSGFQKDFRPYASMGSGFSLRVDFPVRRFNVQCSTYSWQAYGLRVGHKKFQMRIYFCPQSHTSSCSEAFQGTPTSSILLGF